MSKYGIFFLMLAVPAAVNAQPRDAENQKVQNLNAGNSIVLESPLDIRSVKSVKIRFNDGAEKDLVCGEKDGRIECKP